MQAEIWSVDMVTKEYGSGPLYPTNVETGLIRINSHVKVRSPFSLWYLFTRYSRLGLYPPTPLENNDENGRFCQLLNYRKT